MTRRRSTSAASCVRGASLFDAQLLYDGLNRGRATPTPIDWVTVGASLAMQRIAVALTVWYAAFVRRNADFYSSRLRPTTATRLKVLPFLVPAMLVAASVTRLHIGTLCTISRFRASAAVLDGPNDHRR